MKGIWFNNLVNLELQPETRFCGHSLGIEALCFTPDSKQLVTGSHDHTVKLWDVEKGACLRTATPLSLGVWALDCDLQGRVVSTDSNGSIALTDFRVGRDFVRQRSKAVEKGFFVLYSRESEGFFVCGSSKILLINEKLDTVSSHESPDEVFFCAQMAQGKLYSCTSKGSVKVFDQLLQQRGAVQLCATEMRSLQVVGQSLFCSTERGRLDEYELQDEDFVHVKSYGAHTDRVNCIDVSANGELIVSGSKDGTALAWRSPHMNFKNSLVGPKDQVTGARVSPDNRLIALCSWDPLVCLYRADKISAE